MEKIRTTHLDPYDDENKGHPTASSLRLTGVQQAVAYIYDFLLANALQITIIVVGLALLAMLSLRLYLVFAYIPELGGIESNVVYSLQRLLGGYPLYTDPAMAPYAITQYTPLYYRLCQGIGMLLRIDPDNVHHVYILGRGVSLLLNILFAWSVYLILRRVFRTRKSISFIGLVYTFVFLDEESYSRPDSLYNLMMIASVGLFLYWLNTRSKRSPFYFIGICALAIAAIFAKQSAIYLPCLILLFLLFYLRDMRWVALGILTMSTTLTGMLLINGGSDLSTFLQNTVQGINNGASWNWFAEHIMIEHFQKERFINILGVFTGIYFLARGRSQAFKFLGLVTLGALVFATVTSTKIGAAPNYFTEFITLSVIGSILFLTNHDLWLRNRLAGVAVRKSSYKPVFYLILVVFTLIPRFAGKYQKKFVEINNVGQSGYSNHRAVARFLQQEKQLLPEDQVFITTHVHDYLNKFLYRHVVFPQKEIVVANPPNTYDYSSFYRGVQNGTVGYVIASLPEGHVSTVGQTIRVKFDFINTDFSAYVPIKRIDDYIIFEHKSRLHK